MKKIIIAVLVLFSFGAKAQVVTMYDSSGYIIFYNPVTNTKFQLTSINTIGTSAGGGSMTYPGAGIALSTGSAWGTSITDNSTNWNTAYTDRLKWDGGSTGLTAATGRASLGLVIGTDVLAPNGSAASLTSFPTLNQNTTGSAATLTTTRTIWGQNFNGSANVTGDITLGTGNITMTGSIGATGARSLKGWFTDGDFTNMPTVSGTSLSSTFQPLNSNLTTLAGLTATTDNFIVSNASAWASRTPTQAKTSLSLNNVENTALSTWAGTSNITTLGTVTTGTWSGTIIDPAKLGTGSSITTKYLRGDGTWQTLAGGGDALTSNPLSQFASTTSAQLATVMSDETGTDKLVYSASPTLTGTVISNNIVPGNQSIATAAGTTTLTNASPYRTLFTGTSTQTVKLPAANTLAAGTEYYIDNNSTGAVTVQDNGGNTIATVQALHDGFYVVTDISTANGVWDANAAANIDGANTFAGTQTFNGAIVTAAGTTSLAPINIPTSVMKTTPASGDILRDASGVFTATVASSENGILPSEMYSVVGSDFTLSAASGVQSAFPTTGDVWTLAASTLYEVEGNYIMTTGTTSHTTAIAFALAGGASVNYVALNVLGFNAVPGTTATAQGTVQMTGVASTVITAAATTAGHGIYFKGMISVNAGGTLTPQVNFSANPGGTNLMKAGSYIKFKKLGANTFTIIGNVN